MRRRGPGRHDRWVWLRGELDDILAGMASEFELLGEVTDIEAIAVNLSIRDRRQLTDRHGGRRWRKLKGVGLVRFPNGEVRRAELHWYEAHGVGRRDMKVKRVLD